MTSALALFSEGLSETGDASSDLPESLSGHMLLPYISMTLATLAFLSFLSALLNLRFMKFSIMVLASHNPFSFSHILLLDIAILFSIL